MSKQKISERIEVVETPNGFTAHIKAPKIIFLLFFVPLCMVGWAFGTVVVSRVIFSSIVTGSYLSQLLFLLLWLCFWLIAGSHILYAWFWMMFGKEVVSVRGNLLSLKRDIFGRGKTKQIPLPEITRLILDTNPPPLFSAEMKSSYWGLEWNTIEVETLSGTHKFGLQLQDEETGFIFDKLRERLPRKI